MMGPAPREALQMPIKLVFSDSKRAVTGQSVNISETGMLILSKTRRPRGTLVRFEFLRFEGQGEVIWVRESETDDRLTLLGIKFRSLNRRARKELSGLVDDPRN